jgi:hypothetical protein
LTIGRELPRNIVVHTFLKVHPLDESPKLNKLGEVLNRYGSRVTKLGYPLVIAESLVYHPIFALANVKNLDG